MSKLGRKPVIAVPYWPGSNGDFDAVNRIRNYEMNAEPLYFHFGNERRLEENMRRLAGCDGAFIPGGFPYEDRLGFGRVPASIKQFSDAMVKMAQDGKPVLAICAGDQIAQTMRLAFSGTPYKVSMLPNIYDRHGEILYDGFLDRVVHTRLVSAPERNAFTRNYSRNEVMPQVIDHGGGRFWADTKTLQYLLDNDLILKQYCDEDGNVVDNFPTNPNGSMLNIESITNLRGNLKLGMCHDERTTNALYQDRANLSLESMREYIEDGCPDLGVHAHSRTGEIPIRLKDYSYLSPRLDPSRTYDIYVKMLTDDNERTTAQLFLGADIDRRRLIRLELRDANIEDAKRALVEIAKMDILDGIMLKKDLPYIVGPDGRVLSYEVVDRSAGRVNRAFVEQPTIVEGFPVLHEDVPAPNPKAYGLKQRFRENSMLGMVTNVQTGSVFFFPDEASRQKAVEELFY